jgi:hypothetical protein
MMISIILAHKYNEDYNFFDHVYAQVSGIPTSQFILMENIFLNIINYDLYIDSEIFDFYSQHLKSYITKSNYTDNNENCNQEDTTLNVYNDNHNLVSL